MEILTPAKFCAQRGWKPFPPRWDKWLNILREKLLSNQTVSGHLTVANQYPGRCTVVNLADSDASALRRGQGAVPPPPVPIGGGVPPGGGTGGGSGACCRALSGTCEISEAAGCTGADIYLGNGTTCEGVDCGERFCPEPGTYFCACAAAPPPYNYTPGPTCCPNELPMCLTCYNVIGDLYYCCCCNDVHCT